MCTALHCGFPLYSEMSKAYPSVLTQDLLNNVRGAKVGDFHKHMNDPNYLQDKLIRADGYLEQSGWYYPYPLALDCVSQISGCGLEDFSCHDRHALQQLVRGPFKSAFSEAEEKKIIGVPQNFKHGILTLPHKYAPRLDAAVHLRCQFQHFEWLVGKAARSQRASGIGTHKRALVYPTRTPFSQARMTARCGRITRKKWTTG